MRCCLNEKRKNMIKFIVKSLLFLAIIFTFLSCSEYQKVLKSTDYNLKYDKALALYDAKKYHKAQTLLEQIVNIMKGTSKAENTLYYYANCHYKQKDYAMAAYYFDNFINSFAYSEKTPEATYLRAYCYYLNSPKPSLDQADTKKAIGSMQLFINKYPKDERVNLANNIIEKLRDKLEEKSYESAKLYFKLEQYHSATISLKNSIKEYPDTQYREEILYLIVKSNFLLAENSIAEKQAERYQHTVSEYYTFIDEFPKSEYIKEVEKMYKKSVNKLKNI